MVHGGSWTVMTDRVREPCDTRTLLWVYPAVPSCSFQEGDRSTSCDSPEPNGSVPSTAALVMVGLRNAKLIVIRTDLSLVPSRAAMSFVLVTSPRTSSLSQSLALAILSIRRARDSDRIG